MRFTTNDISHVKISYFLRVFKYDFSQWPKSLYNTYVYIINNLLAHLDGTIIYYTFSTVKSYLGYFSHVGYFYFLEMNVLLVLYF
jgi:hypothetical protein